MVRIITCMPQSVKAIGWESDSPHERMVSPSKPPSPSPSPWQSNNNQSLLVSITISIVMELTGLSVYLLGGFERMTSLLKGLGRHKHGKSCLNIKSLDHVDMKVLEEIIRDGWKHMNELYPPNKGVSTIPISHHQLSFLFQSPSPCLRSTKLPRSPVAAKHHPRNQPRPSNESSAHTHKYIHMSLWRYEGDVMQTWSVFR